LYWKIQSNRRRFNTVLAPRHRGDRVIPGSASLRFPDDERRNAPLASHCCDLRHNSFYQRERQHSRRIDDSS
jgi:hypothetical protein